MQKNEIKLTERLLLDSNKTNDEFQSSKCSYTGKKKGFISSIAKIF